MCMTRASSCMKDLNVFIRSMFYIVKAFRLSFVSVSGTDSTQRTYIVLISVSIR